jgi:carbohydrate binding protein with CBM35 domain
MFARFRPVFAALVVALLVTPLTAAHPAGAATPVHEPTWRLRWAPEADQEGLSAFEHVEDDRAHTDPAGYPHIFVDGDAYRFTMNMGIHDISPDRQRNEVRGMRTDDGRTVTLLDGETWRFTYQMFIPDTLKATTRFTHIMQMKAPGTGSDPIVVTSLRRYGTVPRMELRVMTTNTVIGAVDLAPLQNHWIDLEFDIHVGDAPDGWVRWAVRDGDTTVIDTTATGMDTWLFDRVRPKWGIYRSLGDTSGSLQDTYLLIRHLRAYQWTSSPVPAQWHRYEAEDATTSGCAAESANGGFTGAGYVNCQSGTGSFVEWTVRAAARRGPTTLNLWYANATTVDRPMDITVNGVLVAHNLDFGNTPAWTDWESRTLLVSLNPGLNTIRATATTDSGGPDVDSLEVEQPFDPPWD